MKLLLILLFSSFQSFAQEPIGAIEAPELNVLYRGYPNKINVAVTNNDNREVVLTGSNVSITKTPDSEASYIVKPDNKGRTATLTVGLIEGDSIVPVKSIPYRIMYLPDPTLYWGGAKQSGKANIRQRKLFAKYPPEIPISAAFSILNWKIEWNGEQAEGNGSNLTSAEDFLKKIKEKTEVFVTTTVIGPDGIEREISAKWKVDPWDETEESTIRVFKCG